MNFVLVSIWAEHAMGDDITHGHSVVLYTGSGIASSPTCAIYGDT